MDPGRGGGTNGPCPLVNIGLKIDRQRRPYRIQISCPVSGSVTTQNIFQYKKCSIDSKQRISRKWYQILVHLEPDLDVGLGEAKKLQHWRIHGG